MKKFLTLLLALVMALSLIPTTAMAAQKPPVKYGTYGNSDSWYGMPDCSGSITYLDEGVTLSKTATPTENTNEYEVTLTVVTKTTTTTTAASAATVLVIDTSGSMEGDRMSAAKDAAKSFLNTYSGRVEGSADTLNYGRYLAIVPFATNVGKTTGWLDVSNKTDYDNAFNAIDDLYADGGTNLERGLNTANGMLSDSTVVSITNKYVIALTDGEPTYYGTWFDGGGSGSYCNETTYNKTIETATDLKKNATLYTVCFGVANEKMKKGYNMWDGDYYYWDITVGNYLANNIASSADCAYNADNASELNAAFASITQEITSGIDAGTVRDPLPTGNVVIPVAGYAETWELNPEDAETSDAADGTTTYTYTKTYTVKIDPTKVAENTLYQPLNGKTTFVAGETVLEFPVPAGKVTQPETVVTPASFTVKKIDADTKATLRGAEFTLTNNENVEVKKTTNADGFADFTCGGDVDQIPTGSYILAETKAPENYDGTDKTWTVSVGTSDRVYNAEQNCYEVTYSVDVTEVNAATATDTDTENTSALTDGVLTVENKRSTGVITIQKEFARKSRLDGDDIKSVKVNVLDEDNEVVATVTLNKENRWTATTEGLVYGTYTVKEVDASVVGYNLTITYNYGDGAEAVELNGPDANVTITNSYAKQIIPRPTPTTPVEKVSPKTADAGIAIYGVLSVMSVLGTGLVIGKKKEF